MKNYTNASNQENAKQIFKKILSRLKIYTIAIQMHGGDNESQKNTVESSILHDIGNSNEIYGMQNEHGKTIGMLACVYNMKQLAKESAKYSKSLSLKDNKNLSFVDYIKEYTEWNIDEVVSKNLIDSENDGLIDELHKEMFGF